MSGRAGAEQQLATSYLWFAIFLRFAFFFGSFVATFFAAQDLHTFAPWDSNLKTKKSASGKRPPGEAHGPGTEAIRPQQRCLGKSRKEGAHGHAALAAEVGTTLIHRSAFKNSAKFRQSFSHFCNFKRSQNLVHFLQFWSKIHQC